MTADTWIQFQTLRRKYNADGTYIETSGPALAVRPGDVVSLEQSEGSVLMHLRTGTEHRIAGDLDAIEQLLTPGSTRRGFKDA